LLKAACIVYRLSHVGKRSEVKRCEIIITWYLTGPALRIPAILTRFCGLPRNILAISIVYCNSPVKTISEIYNLANKEP
jgi:hypothetical protein